MPITTLDSVAANLQPPQIMLKVSSTGEGAGFLHSTWLVAGFPGAAPAPSSGVAGALLTSPTAGQIPFPAAVGGKNIHLARLEASHASSVGQVIIADRIWQNSGLVVTTATAQTVNSVGWDRDSIIDGVFTGDGVQVGMEVTTTSTPAAAVTASGITISYTNQANVAGRTGTLSRDFPPTATAGTLLPFALQTGDLGIRSVQSITHPTLTTGAYSLVAFRQVAAIGTPSVAIGVQQGGLDLGFPRWHDGSVPWVVFMLGNTAPLATVSVTWVQV